MPELPEVEAARRAIPDHCIARIIKLAVIADDSKVIDSVSPAHLQASLLGKKLVSAHRKGKNEWIQLYSPPFPTFQLGMKKRVDKARTELMMVHKRCEMRPDNVSLARDEVVLQQEFRNIKQRVLSQVLKEAGYSRDSYLQLDDFVKVLGTSGLKMEVEIPVD